MLQHVLAQRLAKRPQDGVSQAYTQSRPPRLLCFKALIKALPLPLDDEPNERKEYGVEVEGVDPHDVLSIHFLRGGQMAVATREESIRTKKY